MSVRINNVLVYMYVTSYHINTDQNTISIRIKTTFGLTHTVFPVKYGGTQRLSHHVSGEITFFFHGMNPAFACRAE